MSGINIFGTYLKETREKHNKTQQQLADAIGKHKMLIYGMEKGHNNPPRGEDMEKMMAALGLSPDECLEFIDKAALHRQSVPDDILSFLLSEPRIRSFLRLAKGCEMTDKKYEQLQEIVRGGN